MTLYHFHNFRNVKQYIIDFLTPPATVVSLTCIDTDLALESVVILSNI